MFRRIMSVIIASLAFTLSAQDNGYSTTTISECLTNCRNISEVISQKETEEGLYITVGAHLNCSVNSQTQVEFNRVEDTLFITVSETKVIYDTVYTKTDTSETITVTEIREAANCKCFFHISGVLEECDTLPKVILINDLTLEENYGKRTIFQLEK